MKVKVYMSVFSMVLLTWSLAALSQSVTIEKVMKPIGFDVLPSLSDVTPIPPAYLDGSWKEKVVPNKDGFLEEFKTESTWKDPDPVLQDNMSGSRSTATIGQNFSGNYNQSGVAPPDTDGDVGLTHYMQMVNLSFQIWDKSGNSVYGPALSSTIWSGFIGPWTGTNDGDPIVLYDQFADRWIASQFSLPNYPSGPFYELVAVSQSGDPTQGWYRYAYEFANMPDYPKFGVWPDGYYMTINQFAPPSLMFAGAGVCVMDRAAMINGNASASMIFFSLSTAYGSLLPADADGAAQPPSGSPAYLANLTTGALRLWSASINWTNPGSSTLSIIGLLPVQSYSYSGIVINQLSTSQTLDALATRLMYRLQYRNFGTYQVMLTNHTVNADGGNQAGVRWYELRDSGSGWSVYQQGTFAPADGRDRWMGSIAMNGNGDIAIGYSVSSSSMYPAVRCAGQTAANSGTGILDVTETSIKEGTASQTGVNRWGDYSMMSVDPSDDNTFWYTSEYSNGGWSWRTQIASFNFTLPVVIPPVADFSGNPTTIMEGEQVSFTDLSTNGATSWSWTFEGGTPATSTERNPVVTYSTAGTWDVTLFASNSSGDDTETKVDYITVTPYVAPYCNSSGTNVTKEWINTMTLGTFTNNSGPDGGYGNYVSTIISLESGTTYDLSLVPGYSGKPRLEFWRVWIDFNMDSDFLDAGELVYSADAKKGATSGTISIPTGLNGQTRMRISMEYNIAPASCDVFTFGEVEDYTVSFAAPVPQPPVAYFYGTPTTIDVGGSVQFTDQSSNNPTSWLWTFENGTPLTSTEQNPIVTYTVIGIHAVTLEATNNVGTGTYFADNYITVNEVGGTGEYCTSGSQSNSVEWITNVGLSVYSNPSGPSLYSDFTSMVWELAAGSSNSLVLTPNTTNQRNFWRVWIDFNADGDFDDSGEQVYAINNKKGPATGTVTIPTGVSGSTRMRVSMKVGGAQTACETFADGEVEDYTITFSNGPASIIRQTDLSLELFPNPANSELNIIVSGNSDKINIKIYNALGQIIDDFNVENGRTVFDLQRLPKGLYYVGAEDRSHSTLKKFIKD